MQTTGPSFRKSKRAIRLTFAYDGESIRLISRQKLDKRTSPSNPLRDREQGGERSGFWFELRDREGHALYRQVLHNPIKTTVEVRSEDPEQPFEQHQVQNPRGTFFLLTPDLPEARTVSLWSSPLEPRAAQEPAREIASFRLREDRHDQNNGKDEGREDKDDKEGEY